MALRHGEDALAPVALGLSLLVPGLGHTLYKRWLRSFVWFMAIVLTLTALLLQAGVGEVASLGGLFAAIRTELDVTVQVGLLGLHLIQAIDAYALEPGPTELLRPTQLD